MQYHYTTPRGNEVSSYEPMSAEALREWDVMMAGYEDWLDEQGIESEEDYRDWMDQQAEDWQAEGFGWEQKALDNVAAIY